MGTSARPSTTTLIIVMDNFQVPSKTTDKFLFLFVALAINDLVATKWRSHPNTLVGNIQDGLICGFRVIADIVHPNGLIIPRNKFLGSFVEDTNNIVWCFGLNGRLHCYEILATFLDLGSLALYVEVCQLKGS